MNEVCHDRISAIHHVTAIAGDPQLNLDFHVGVLGLRLVKQTVNFDDPGTWHFYFADAHGSPGSVLTYFPWPHVKRGQRGSGEVAAMAFAVARSSLEFWSDRLRRLGAAPTSIAERFGEPWFAFDDPDGTRLEMVGTDAVPPTTSLAPDAIAPEHAIRGIHSVTLAVAGFESTARLLADTLGFERIVTETDGDPNRHRFVGAASSSSPGRIIDLRCTPDAPPAKLGGGSVHHVAFRTEDEAASARWRERLVDGGFNATPILDRQYFRSLYFREPGGVILELATDPPGFTTDEPADALGTQLMLPPWLEPRRETIIGQLPTVRIPSVVA